MNEGSQLKKESRVSNERGFPAEQTSHGSQMNEGSQRNKELGISNERGVKTEQGVRGLK